MRKTIAYSLLIIVLFAFNYKAVNSFFKLSKKTVVYIQDCEETNQEPEESKEKNEKKDSLEEDLFLNNGYSFVLINRLIVAQQSDATISTSNYGLTVYSPPELG